MTTAAQVVLVDDDQLHNKLIGRWLEQDGHDVAYIDSGEGCLDLVQRVIPDVVCLDMRMPGLSGIETLERLKLRHPALPVVMLSAEESVDLVVRAMQLGAFDYLTKPAERRRLNVVIEHALRQHSMSLRLATLEREASAEQPYPGIVSVADEMKGVFRQLDRLVRSDITVLVHGESGTGKELIASAIHYGSSRAGGPLVAVNCGAIPASLQESELFGHEKGAFTGAATRKAGRFEQADGGTLFLDEVAELTPATQAMLLRVLQERRFSRLGGALEIRSDFRLIAASHQRLRELVDAGRFREDLFFRIAVFELDLPPLRDRRGDVLVLAEHFLAQAAALEGCGRLQLSAEAREALSGYTWPGNVRELQNAMRRAAVLSEGDVVEPEALPDAVRRFRCDPQAARARSAEAEPAHESLLLEDVERRTVERAHRVAEGNVSEMARLLGISRATLYRKLKAYNITA